MPAMASASTTPARLQAGDREITARGLALLQASARKATSVLRLVGMRPLVLLGLKALPALKLRGLHLPL